MLPEFILVFSAAQHEPAQGYIRPVGRNQPWDVFGSLLARHIATPAVPGSTQASRLSVADCHLYRWVATWNGTVLGAVL